MDIRVVNTCNNNCLYCLEQEYREKQEYFKKSAVFKMIDKIEDKTKITFYGGNPLLHPDLVDILKYAKYSGFTSIGVLTNTHTLSKWYLYELMHNGLTTVGFYFNSFDANKHEKIVNGGIKLNELKENIHTLQRSEVSYKTIIHINKQNIESVYRDVVILNKKHFVKSFEFINYFPFDRPYNEFKNELEYNYEENRKYISLLFNTLKKLKVEFRFVKFSKDFFGNNLEFYDFKNGIIDQICEDDKERLLEKKPFCLEEKRCYSCFIKDDCNLMK